MIAIGAMMAPAMAAETMPGTALVDYCDRDPEGFCLGYIAGIAEARPGFCVPATGLSFGQLRRVAVKYLNDHPERLNQPAPLELVASALRLAFPCPKTPPTQSANPAQ
jgi:hypothetical protein